MERDRYAVDGSRGFIGEHFVSRVGEENTIRLPRFTEPQIAVDYYISLSAYGNMSGQDNIQETVRANVTNLMDRLSFAEDYDYKAFVVVSTSSVTLPTQTPYSRSKKIGEEFAQLEASKGKPVVIVRPYSITGVGEQKEHLIPKLIDSCMTGTEIPFVNEPVHDFLDVSDFVDGLLIVAKNAQEHKGEIFSIGSGKQYTNRQVLDLVQLATGRQANIKLVDSLRSYDTKEWRADTTAMYALGWEPKKSLLESIEEQVKAYGA